MLIANSSIVRPVLRAAASQRGCLPRPDHVSDGSFGFRYFGNTRGYLRRSRGAPDCASAGSSWCVSFSRRSCASRFSSSRFSDVKRTDKTSADLLVKLPHLIDGHAIEILLLVHPACNHHDLVQGNSPAARLSSEIVDLATTLAKGGACRTVRPKWFKYLLYQILALQSATREADHARSHERRRGSHTADGTAPHAQGLREVGVWSNRARGDALAGLVSVALTQDLKERS